VSTLTNRLWEDYEAFTQPDLSGFAVKYLFLDAIYESLRLQGGGREGLLCAWGILADGRKVLLHLMLGNRELRTTNLIERSFEEERRRTKIIPRFFDERSCLKLVYATLVRANQRCVWEEQKEC
jgi:transposase-like protein